LKLSPARISSAEKSVPTMVCTTCAKIPYPTTCSAVFPRESPPRVHSLEKGPSSPGEGFTEVLPNGMPPGVQGKGSRPGRERHRFDPVSPRRFCFAKKYILPLKSTTASSSPSCLPEKDLPSFRQSRSKPSERKEPLAGWVMTSSRFWGNPVRKKSVFHHPFNPVMAIPSITYLCEKM